jgi:hypothetical protein
MFGWNYYKPMCKEFKFFDEFQRKAFSRKNVHNKTHMNKKKIWGDFINELPNSAVKDIIQSTYEREGETGMVEIHKIIKQVCQNSKK